MLLNSMIKLRKITHNNVKECIRLEVAQEQQHFVAANVVSLAQAYVALANDDCVPMPFAVYQDNTMVGFIMFSYIKAKDGAGKGKYYIWRLMIDKRYQKKGYGRQVMERVLEMIRAFPCGDAEEVTLSYEPDNHVARRLYASLGFRERDEMDEDEQVAYLRL